MYTCPTATATMTNDSMMLYQKIFDLSRRDSWSVMIPGHITRDTCVATHWVPLTRAKPLFSHVRKYRWVRTICVSLEPTFVMDSSSGADEAESSAACASGRSNRGSDSTVMSKSICQLLQSATFPNRASKCARQR